MFEKKEVTPKTTASALHESNEEFLKYGLSVFRNVFTQLKNKHGVYRKLKLHFLKNTLSFPKSVSFYSKR